MARQAGPVRFMIGCWSNAPFIVNGTGGNVYGEADPRPYWIGSKLRIPNGDPPLPCTIWGAFQDQGTNTGGVFTHAIPAGSCAGTINVSGAETFGRPRGDDYGYSFEVRADGVLILNSGCLVNAATQAAIPAGTLSVEITVTVNCAGGSTVGEWSAQGTCP